MMDILTQPETWIAFFSLTALEIVLGIDNIVFIAILTGGLAEEQQKIAYKLGLGGAMVTRVLLLFAISWVMGLTDPLFEILEQEISGRDLILLFGGVFLIGKSAHEIYEKVEAHEEIETKRIGKSLVSVVVQIMILDIVFSLDSVITAVGMVNQISIMVAAVIAAILVMLIFAKRVGDFVNKHPSVKILALSFLLLIGVLLTAEGFDQHISKAYIYSAMGFALFVEMLNLRFRSKHTNEKTA